MRLLCVLPCSFGRASEPVEEGWKRVSESNGLEVYNRPRKDSSVLEVKAVSILNAAPSSLKRVIDDLEEYPHFMPYVAESKVISREGNTVVSYQRISLPLISDRDYVLRIRSETLHNADGSDSYRNRWDVANDIGPAEKSGVARVKVNEGYWLLEPVNAGKQTRATYFIYSDSGGSLPSAMANAGNRTALPKLFEAVLKQARLEKYSK